MSDPDPRLLLHRSFDQAAQVVAGVSPEQLTAATPCRDFDVAALLIHIAGVANRVVGIGRGEQQTNTLPVPEGIGPAEIGAAFETAREQARSGWADDELLERKIDLPFGTFAGAAVAQIYTLELTMHSWDLASATGQLGSLDEQLAEASLDIARGVLPPEPRGGFMPFESVVPVAADAPAYDRLAGYLGRSAG